MLYRGRRWVKFMDGNIETLYLIWRLSEDESITIGELNRKDRDKYYFKYDLEGVREAIHKGFQVLSTMPIITAKYFKEELFSIFQRRVSGKHKKEILEDIEEKQDEYDDFTLLMISKGKCIDDGLEFVSSVHKLIENI